jgi:hypothetical protein
MDDDIYLPFEALENPLDTIEGYIDVMSTGKVGGSDVLDKLIQLELVKNQRKDSKKNKNEGQTFLDSYLA